jgi:hypothetical protein
MSMTIREVYEWHLENAQECRGNELQNQKRMHLDMAEALKEHLPPQPCGLCRGSGLLYLQDSDAYDIVACDCQYAHDRN